MSAWERLNPALFKHFLAISRAGSLSGAAKTLHCVPSNVSARLRQLESQLGVALFRREAQRLILTPAGIRLLPHAEQFEQVCRQAWHSVQADPWSGELRLGSMETTAAVRLPDVLAAFHREAPRVSLSLVTGPSQYLIQEVLAGRLDAALIGGPYSHAQLIGEEIWQEELVVALPAGASLAHLTQSPVTLLGFPNGCHYRERLERWSARQSLQIAAQQSYGSIEAILGGIAAGMGIGLLPRSLLQTHPRGRLVDWQPIEAELAQAPTLLIRRHDQAPSPLLERLRERLHGG